MRATITGPYPRVGSEIGDELRKEQNRVYSGHGSLERVRELQEKLTREIVSEIVLAGIDLPNSGLIDVHDELTWPLEFAYGVEFGGMKKIFHTNMHYREVLVGENISKKGSIANGLFNIAFEVSQNVKLELPGPYTMARHSVLVSERRFSNLIDLAREYAGLYRQELIEIEREGNSFSIVQFNEPSIVAFGRSKEEIDKLPEIYSKMLDGLNLGSAVCTYYGKYDDKTLDILLSLPVGTVGLDFVWDPEVEKIIKRKDIEKGIGFGLVDSGDRGYIAMENVSNLLDRLRSFRGYVDFSKSYISSNATLEHLPRNIAREKIKLIGETVRRFNDEN
ncbi:hypothetical protein HYV50_00490 [Candidatus Pacearchaeota archaeon]|nr:hypothetical protein [Candidatus Pacearchaeota archaeon]